MTNKDTVRQVKVALKELQERIPRDESGDPAFRELGDPFNERPLYKRLYCFDHKSVEPPTDENASPNKWQVEHHTCNTGEHPDDVNVLEVFTPEQVVAMVNRYLYQAEYQQVSHKQYQEKRRAFERPIKEAAKRLFPGVSFINLTEQQLEEAIRAAHERKE